MISFDFDDTLIKWGSRHFEDLQGDGPAARLFDRAIAAGVPVAIVTARWPELEAQMARIGAGVHQWLAARGVPEGRVQVVLTSNQPKGPFLAELGARVHYDDNRAQCASAEAYGVHAILVV